MKIYKAFVRAPLRVWYYGGMKRTDRGNMEQFYSSLTQLTLTLLVVLTAWVAGYYVYLQQRRAQFDEAIEKEKLSITQDLTSLRADWPWTMNLRIPMEFKETYRQRYDSLNEIEFLKRAIMDMYFSKDPMEEVLRGLERKGGTDRPRRGRLYFWVLTEAIRTLTVGDPTQRSTPISVFPNSALGPGFSEWVRIFEQLDQNLMMMQSSKVGMVHDFGQYVKTLPKGAGSPATVAHMEEAVSYFFAKVANVRSSLIRINGNVLLRGRHQFSAKIHSLRFALLAGLAFIAGGVVPLLLLGWGVSLDGIGNTAIGIAALTLTLGAIGGFAYDVVRPERFTVHEYISARWYEPLLEVVEENIRQADEAGLVDTELILDALTSDEASEFDPRVREGLDELLTVARQYNQALMQFNNASLDILTADSHFGPHMMSNEQVIRNNYTVYLGHFLEQEKFDRLVGNFGRAAEVDYSVELRIFRGSRILGRISGNSISQRVPNVLLMLGEIRDELLGVDKATKLSISRGNVLAKIDDLQTAIRAAQ